METLLEDYKRRLITVNKMIDSLKEADRDVSSEFGRLVTKRSCYMTFIIELERELKNK